jgi:anti-sigma-K factor RskA
MESLTMHDLTAAYALDALDADEAREYENHLATCEQCREELVLLGGAAGALAFAVESPAPPPELRSRILESARAERPNVVPLRQRWTVVTTAIAAVAATAAIGFGIWAALLANSLDSERSARDQADRALKVLSDPAASRFALEGKTRGSLVVAQDGRAALVVSRLAPAPSGKTYEAWVIEDGMPVRAGTFEGGPDTSVVALERSVPKGATVAVTVEPRPGRDQPSGSIVLSGKTA